MPMAGSTVTTFSDETKQIVKRLEQAGDISAAVDLRRWRHLAQHLCFKAGHGPKRHALDPKCCGRCEAVIDHE
jgi:hypothetical protein